MTRIYMVDHMGAAELCGFGLNRTLPCNKPVLLGGTTYTALGSQYLFNYVERFT
jgi:hypothetical protein